MKCEVCGSDMELILVRLLDGAKLVWVCHKCGYKKPMVFVDSLQSWY